MELRRPIKRIQAGKSKRALSSQSKRDNKSQGFVFFVHKVPLTVADSPLDPIDLDIFPST